MGPLEASIAWSQTALTEQDDSLTVSGVCLLRRMEHFQSKVKGCTRTSDLDKSYHQTVKKVTEDYEGLRFNTAISQLMVFINDAYKADSTS